VLIVHLVLISLHLSMRGGSANAETRRYTDDTVTSAQQPVAVAAVPASNELFRSCALIIHGDDRRTDGRSVGSVGRSYVRKHACLDRLGQLILIRVIAFRAIHSLRNTPEYCIMRFPVRGLPSSSPCDRPLGSHHASGGYLSVTASVDPGCPISERRDGVFI